jgi:hypothetical protein
VDVEKVAAGPEGSMITHEGRQYVIKREPITDSHGNHHGWFCRVQSEDGRWRVVTGKHKLEKFRLQASDDGLAAFVDEIREGLICGSLIAEPRPDVQASEPPAR